LSKGKAKIDWGGRGTGKSSRPADGIAQFHPPGHTSAEARQRSGLVWSGLKGGLAKAKFFYQSARPAGSEPFPPASSLAEARPAGGWHCSVSSARPYLSRGEAEVWSGLKGRMAETKFFSQPCRRADGIAQFHPPGHTSAEARWRSGLD
jgi:hypothetical protein